MRSIAIDHPHDGAPYELGKISRARAQAAARRRSSIITGGLYLLLAAQGYFLIRLYVEALMGGR